VTLLAYRGWSCGSTESISPPDGTLQGIFPTQFTQPFQNVGSDAKVLHFEMPEDADQDFEGTEQRSRTDYCLTYAISLTLPLQERAQTLSLRPLTYQRRGHH
jgi:hypothetical protein